MVSNFLGEVSGSEAQTARSAIISGAELMAREGVNPQKGMNFRDKGPLLSVFLVLRRGEEFHDVWDAKKGMFFYEGHDSTTVESGKFLDQILMYESGKLTDNGKFYKEAQAYKDGVRKEPLQIQVYEKLDAGVWYDKGIFDLVDAAKVKEGGRVVIKFSLAPKGETTSFERFLPASVKEEVWKRDGGRCSKCHTDADLYFIGRTETAKQVHLLCAKHSGMKKHGLL